MMLIACPHCGPRAHVEFTYERTMDAILSVDVDPDTAVAILFQRENPRGPSQELWRHTYGCRSWLRLTRNTVTHDLAEVVAWPPA